MALSSALQGFIAARQQGDQQDTAQLQQAGALQALLSKAGASERDAQAREIIGSGAPPEQIFAALSKVSPEHAQQYAKGLKEMQAIKMSEAAQRSLQGEDGTPQSDPTKLRKTGEALIAAGHPGGAPLLAEAQRRQAEADRVAQLREMRGTPAIAPDPQEVAQGADQGTPVPQPVPAKPGIGEDLLASSDPSIAASAKNIRLQIANAGTSAKPEMYQTAINNLYLRQAALDRARTAVAEKSKAAEGPGGVGSKMYQDPQTGQKYLMNKAGNAFELDDEGNWKATNPNNLPKNLSPVGNIGTAGSRENVFTQRLIQAGNQASKDLENVTKLPLTSSRGPFGAFGSVSTPSFMDAGKTVLGNAMTNQEQQTYNTMSVGFQRTLAAIESAGLMPSGTLTHQMDAVIFKPGDTQLTKLHKLAQTRQIVESGLEVVMSNPRISDDEKTKVKEIMGRLEKAVPFTHSDLIELAKRQEGNPDATLRSVLKKDEAPSAASGPKVGDKSTSKSGKPISWDGKQWVYD
jgi:hypothetical protein